MDDDNFDLYGVSILQTVGSRWSNWLACVESLSEESIGAYRRHNQRMTAQYDGWPSTM